MTKRYKLISIAEVPDVARDLVHLFEKNDQKKIAFYGLMGAGKTTLINELLHVMQTDDKGSSPTFSIVNEHWSDKFGKIYHFDFYRLNHPTEALDIGIEEVFEENAWCFMEWPEKIGNLLPENSVMVRITEENGSRLIDVEL